LNQKELFKWKPAVRKNIFMKLAKGSLTGWVLAKIPLNNLLFRRVFKDFLISSGPGIGAMLPNFIESTEYTGTWTRIGVARLGNG